MTDRRTLIIGTFGPRSAAEMLRLLSAPSSARADLIELRLDLVPDAGAHVDELVAASPRPVVATCRRENFSGTEDERLAVLAAAVAAGAAWVDVEHDVPADRVPTGAQVIRSRHVGRLGDDAEEIAAQLVAAGDVGKLVALDGDDADALRMLRLVDGHAGRLAGHIVAKPFTRFASSALGAPFVYAALRPGGRLGIDLPTVGDYLDRALLHDVRRGSRVWILLGGGVDGSVSPDMLNAAFEHLGADAVALRWSATDPRPALDALRDFGWLGMAVTMPFKEAVLGHVREHGTLRDDARAVGALNTVWIENDELVGDNTDVAGILGALAETPVGRGLDGGTALVLGAGGAARAAVHAVERLGGRSVVYARRPEQARRLLEIGATQVVDDARAAVATAPKLVLNATPGGTEFFDPSRVRGELTVLDMRVRALESSWYGFLTRAAEQGLRESDRHVVPGAEMLLHQAAEQVRRVLGRDPDVDVMARAGQAQLDRPLRRVVLVGLRCSGKTTIGTRLARMRSRGPGPWPDLGFHDVDQIATETSGASPDEWIASGQEATFRRHEAEAMVSFADELGGVVATGGGAALSPGALGQLCGDAAVVLLDAADDVLLARWAESPRAALSELSPRAELARQRAERMSIYEELATLTVDTGVADVTEVVETILGHLLP